MSPGKKAKGVAAGVGGIGAIGAMFSIWWFALRPRRNRSKAARLAEDRDRAPDLAQAPAPAQEQDQDQAPGEETPAE